jgi:hypothetical protein
MRDLHGSLLLPVDEQREDHRTRRVRTQLVRGQLGLAQGAGAPALGYPGRGLDVGESRDEQLRQVVEYLEAGSTAGLKGSDDRVDAAEAERAEAPRATGRGLPVLAELRVLQQSEERDQVVEVAQDPVRVEVTHRPTQSNP